MMGADGIASELPSGNEPIKTRFVVDILSGSSAGGINAVFLAKALANNQSLSNPKSLWIEQGDLDLLINDQRSQRKEKNSKKKISGLSFQKKPQSLLNSQQIYRKFLDALDEIDGAEDSFDEKKKSPYAKNIDLFVTVTNYHGQEVKLQLSDAVVEERRYRYDFHFRNRDDNENNGPGNEFSPLNNGMLAFAARCTSSFPFAFESMQFSDIETSLRAASKPWHPPNIEKAIERWRPFFEDHQKLTNEDIKELTFVDGGYLDNKPFGYAIEHLSN